MQKSIEKILVDIIKKCLNLPDNYGTTSKGDVIPSVMIYSQNIKLFNTDKLQITVQTVSRKTYSNRIEFVNNPDSTGDADAYLEIQDLNEGRVMQIDLRSRNNDAINRAYEIPMALKSIEAEQQMDLYNFKIGTITDSRNTSGVDGGSDLNRWTITFNVITHEHKETVINYYDKFAFTLSNEEGYIYQSGYNDSEDDNSEDDDSEDDDSEE